MSAAATALIIVGVLGAIIVLVLLGKLADKDRTHDEEKRRMQERFAADIEEARLRARQEAGRGSRAVHLGRIGEQIAPLLPDFPYQLKDVQWVGGAIDAIVWDGLAEGRNLEIVFLDVKTGRGSLSGQLTDAQKLIQQAVAEKRVRFDVYRPAFPALDVMQELPETTIDPGIEAH